MELWRKVLVKHIGRRILHKAESLIVNIIAVDVGIKPSYLYDVGKPDGEKLSNFLQELKLQGLIRNNLNVLEIGMDCLVVNVEELKKTVQIEKLNERLVDVSKALDKPCICSNLEEVDNIKEVFNNMFGELESDRVKFCTLSHSTCNVTSMFGLLLNYPLIYWYETPDGSGDNCLSMEQLKCVKVFISCDQKKGIKPNSERITVDEHCLYSFSYPACLGMHCRPTVDQWFDKLKELVLKQEVFSALKLTFEDFTLPAVSL